MFLTKRILVADTNSERNLQVQITSENNVELTWSEKSSDILCNGLRSKYKVQWKRVNQTANNVEYVNARKFVITGKFRCFRVLDCVW